MMCSHRSHDLSYIGIDGPEREQYRNDEHHKTYQSDQQKIVRQDAENIKTLKKDRCGKPCKVIDMLFSELTESDEKPEDDADDKVGKRKTVGH